MLNDDGIEKGYPKSISKEFYGLPSYLDAAFTWTNGKTYFFKVKNVIFFSSYNSKELLKEYLVITFSELGFLEFHTHSVCVSIEI